MEIDDLINNLEDDYGESVGEDKDNKKARNLQKLTEIWQAERIAPEILQFETELLDQVMERLRSQIEFIEMHTADLATDKHMKLKLLLVETELERVKFLIRGYLRARIHKVGSDLVKRYKISW